MRVLFVMRHGGYVRNFEWVLRQLAERSHHVLLGFERSRVEGIARRPGRGRGDFALPERLHEETGGAIDHAILPSRDDRWQAVAFALRQTVSYLRYLTPAYRNAEKLRARWARRTPRLLVRLSALPVLRSQPVIGAVGRLLRAIEHALPRSNAFDAYLREGAFDLVLVTPLVDGPSQHDWLRSAQALGIPAALAVASWDNLTNKGVMFDRPLRTYVWNEIQRQEAVELHGLAPDSVAVVGAHSFDHWFEWQPSTSREEFCRDVGLDARHPFLLYVCSSGFISSDERPIVARWVEAVRTDPELEHVGVLVRPHPVKGQIWQEHPLGSFANVVIWPPVGADPNDAESRTAYFDSIWHAAAVVGANTTALIDAAIVGRQTFSVLLPELRGAQAETLHFHYLLPENGGALTVAGTLEEHLGHLRRVLAGSGGDEWRAAFLERFVRPHGLTEPCAPRFADDLETLVARLAPPQRVREPVQAA